MSTRTGRLASGLVALTLAGWCYGSDDASAAAIRGTVLYVGPPPERKQIPINIDQYVCGKSRENEELVIGPNRGIRWAVVSLQNPPAGARPDPSAAKPVSVDQQQCVYVPRVVVVPVGGTVDFLNSDRLLHNLHSTSSENPTFSRTQPKGRTIPVVFKKPEIVRIDCDLHTWMRAWVVVAEHPFFAVTGPQGEFVLDSVPPGKYTLKVWQETLGTVTREVTVGEQDTTGVTVELRKK
jgi:plastocyanin